MPSIVTHIDMRLPPGSLVKLPAPPLRYSFQARPGDIIELGHARAAHFASCRALRHYGLCFYAAEASIRFRDNTREP